MAATRRGRSGRRRQQTQTLTGPITTAQTASTRRQSTINKADAYPAYVQACIGVIGVMKRFGMAGVEKMAHSFAENGQTLVSPSAFLNAVSTGGTSGSSGRRISGGRSTSRRAGGRVARAPGVLTAAQQQVLNSINPNEQLNRAQITARTGMAAANIARTLPALKNKGYLQSSGRGQNATFWKVQQPLAQAV